MFSEHSFDAPHAYSQCECGTYCEPERLNNQQAVRPVRPAHPHDSHWLVVIKRAG